MTSLRITMAPITSQYKNAQNGLTLLELILVLFLLGLVLSVVIGTLPENDKNALKMQNEQWAKGFNLLLNDARFEGRFFGLSVSETQWQWVKAVPKQNEDEQSPPALEDQAKAITQLYWERIERRHLVTQTTLPEGVVLQLRLGEVENGALPNSITLDKRINDAVIKPQIWILPGGEVTPFILEFYDENMALLQRWRADTAGNLTEDELE